MTGRIKDLIILGGQNVVPADIEEVVDRVAGVRYSAAVGIDSERTGTQRLHVVAEVRERDAARRATITTSSARSSSRVHRGQRPPAGARAPGALGQHPKTSSGKIQRSRLAETDARASALRDRLVYHLSVRRDASRREARAMDFGCHLPVYGPAATREVLLGFRAAHGGARLRLAVGERPHGDSLRDRVALSLQPDRRLSAAAGHDFLEPLVALGLVAGVTERIQLGTTVLVLPHRHPVLAAKVLATLDHLAPVA